MRDVIERPEGLLGERAFVRFDQLGIPNLDHLGRLKYTSARQPLDVHSHPGAFEICYLDRGTQTYQIDGREYPLVGGDIFVTFPDEAHSTGTHPEEKSVLYWITVADVVGDSGFLGLGAESTELLDALRNLPRRSFRALPGVRSHLDAIFQIDRRREMLRRHRILYHVVEFLSLVVQSAVRAPSDIRHVPAGGPFATHAATEGVADVASYIAAHLREDLPLEALAEVAGCSLPHFKRTFRAEIGMPPRQYVLREKIEAARRMLGDASVTITEAAFHLGFSSSQYFATVYRRFTGKSPSADRG